MGFELVGCSTFSDALGSAMGELLRSGSEVLDGDCSWINFARSSAKVGCSDLLVTCFPVGVRGMKTASGRSATRIG